MDPAMYQYRGPIDLTNARLRSLATALGPAYVRVSGTWTNTVYFHDSDSPAPKSPPEGFDGVLTRKQWRGVGRFRRRRECGDRYVVRDQRSHARRDRAPVRSRVEACASMGAPPCRCPPTWLSREWLARSGAITSFYEGLRDRYLPGKPMWLTDTADAACVGNPWASTFLDSLRYLDEHGRLAKAGVQVIAHNTLASSDYGLLDGETFRPRPNY
jgi:hypothetical protein